MLSSGVNKLVGHIGIVALRIFLGKILGKHIVSGRSEAVAAHTAIVFALVGGLSRRSEAHNDIAALNVGIIDNIAALHTASDSAVHNDGAHQIAHVGGFAAGAVDVYTKFAKLGKEFFSAIDDGSNHLTGNKQLVAANGR